MKTFFQLRESTLQEKTLELAGVTLQHMEHCPGAVAAFKRNLKDGASEADVAKAAKAVDNYLAIEDKAIKAGKATDDDVEEMEKRIDRAEKIIAQLGLEGHTYHDMHLDRVEDMVEDDDEDEDEDDEDEEDEDDDLKEKTLTPAEKKKREEIAQAIKRDNPRMPMDKKMAIATATAKRVAEAAPKMKHMVDPLKKAREQDRAHDASMGRTATGRKQPQRAMTSTQRSMASMRNEEVNELSKSTLGSYIKKASASAVGIGSGIGADAAKNRKAHPDDTRQLRNRMKGVQRATDRLTKEEVNEISDKMKDRMKKRNRGMTRAFGGKRD